MKNNKKRDGEKGISKGENAKRRKKKEGVEEENRDQPGIGRCLRTLIKLEEKGSEEGETGKTKREKREREKRKKRRRERETKKYQE